MSTEDLIDELFRRGQLIRDHWWDAYKANLGRLAAELRANEAFVADYGHLTAQLPDPPADPFASPPLQSSHAPPLDPSWTHPQPSDDFLQQHIARHGPPPGGGQ